jgi:hypothetical protein
MWSAEAGSFSFILGEIHFAVLRPAGYACRKKSGSFATALQKSCGNAA